MVVNSIKKSEIFLNYSSCLIEADQVVFDKLKRALAGLRSEHAYPIYHVSTVLLK